MIVFNQNNNFNSGEYNSPEINIDSNLKRWFTRNVGLWKSSRTYFLEQERKTYNLCMFINIEALENKKLKVLELGGTGQDAVAWAQLGFDVTFIDLSKENIKKTEKFIKGKNLNLRCINKNFLKQNFKEKFNIIRSRGVIHHISQPEKVFLKFPGIFFQSGIFQTHDSLENFSGDKKSPR